MPQSRHRKRRGRASSAKRTQKSSSISKRNQMIVFVIIAIFLVAGLVFVFSKTQAPTSSMITTPSGLQYIDLVEGTGASPAPGKQLTMHYKGTFPNGEQFDSSIGKQPMTFRLGVDPMIKGWDEGVMGMKVGGKRKLVVPPDLAYGEKGRSGIPPNSTLIFELELLDVK